ncbi:hypothetical protein [Nocardia rhizosphaerihabitans]|uniref:Uncharacterized protein n=1 Tax=Nocardia rhizosphaerihabitans TaxID=1691570 RepID=A0ABQ2KXW4_9NOCA|nr:hypothetical protein [Nocardia rhizosphaerihabitans]GGN96097.1 hypothetical protein GCM10011610_60780 [Nocardia rhizosphaerihabitans]
METDFSEFSFGYAAIREAESVLSGIYRRSGAPVLPSLLLEERLGWDAKLSMVEYALFLQFKRPTFVSRRHPSSPTWDHIGNPHYRFAVDTDEHQHQRLLELERKVNAGREIGDVYYVAPCFHTQDDFNDAYLAGTVLENSVVLSPSELGANDGRHHCVTDSLTKSTTVMSHPRHPRRPVDWADIQHRTSGRADTWERSQDRLNLSALEQALLHVTEGLTVESRRDRNVPVTRRIDRLATVLGCGLVLLGSYDEDNSPLGPVGRHPLK